MSNRLGAVAVKRADGLRAGDVILEPPLMVGEAIVREPFCRHIHDIQIFGDDVIINNWDKITSIGTELLVIERDTK